jgi:hypothetical protein
MKANELRIGNFVQYDHLKNPIKVSIIDTTEQSTKTKAKPIPLTEEWLLKFGCQRTRGGWFISADYFLYNPLTEFDIPSSKYYGLMFNDKYVTTRAVQYVHQLQNLYFALTGKELQLTDKNG